jgi:predicted AlkP superfamily pyrophosphatase or phosphodiesterase
VATLAQLTQSIYSTLGLSDADNALNLPKSESQLEVLFLIDGLGYQFMGEVSQRFPVFGKFTHLEKDSPAHSHFPTTTVTNLTSLATGELPGVHGMLGYTVRVPHSGNPERLLNGLKWDERVDPVMWQKNSTLFERGAEVGIRTLHIAAKRYEGSGFTRAALRGGEYFGSNKNSEVAQIAARENKKSQLKGVPTFTYLYINHVDAAGHEDGVYSEKWWSGVGSAAQLVTELLELLPKGVRLWLTADHGMVNSKDHLILGDNNPLMNDVALVGGEPRARHLYLFPEGHSSYGKELGERILIARKEFSEFLEDKADVYSRDEIISSGLLGEVNNENALPFGNYSRFEM